MADRTVAKETRLLLIGKTGSGKSSTGNSILGDKVFQTSLSFSSSTRTSCYEEKTLNDRRVVVVDTPGFYDTVKTNQEIVHEISKVFGYLSSGFHAMLYILNTERFSQESIQTKKLFFRTFGEDVKKFTIIILTHYDKIKEEGITSVTEYLKHSGPEFNSFFNACSGRLVAFNNKAIGTEMHNQVTELIRMVDKINKDNYGNVYTNFHFRLVRAFIKIERKKKRDLKKARKQLFTRAIQTLGMERTVTWDMENDRPMRLKALEDQAEIQKSTAPTILEKRNVRKIKAIPVTSRALKTENLSTANSLKNKEENGLEPTTKTVQESNWSTPAVTVSTISRPLENKFEVTTPPDTETISSGNVTTDSNQMAKETVCGPPALLGTASFRTDHELNLQTMLEEQADTSNWHEEDEDDTQEERKAVQDGNILKRLVDFFAVFFENLIK